MWNIYRCREGILWDTFRGNLGILSRLIFLLWITCFYAVFLFCFNFSTYYFCHLTPKKRFLDICTSSYHALTCDYGEFHAYIALCGCSDRVPVDLSFVQQGEAFCKRFQHLWPCPREAAVKAAAEVPPFGMLLVSVKAEIKHRIEKFIDFLQ